MPASIDIDKVKPVTTVVFSGHMIDAPDRDQSRFPPDHVPRVRELLELAITDIEDPDTVAVSGAACGADLLFCQVWLATDRRLEVFLPQDSEAFLDESVRFAGPEWEARFHRVVDHPKTKMVGAPPDLIRMENPHAANNLRLLERARQGTLPLRGIFVWDGGGGDGPGGTGHMVSEVEDAGGEVMLIEP